MMTLGETCALLTGATLRGAPAVRYSGVSTDSRSAQPGDLFVALSGERFDGHTYVAEAIARGAVAVLAERALALDVPALAVTDTRRALGELARGWRCRFALPLIAVVGSNGKTTTKEMLAAILAAQFGEDRRLATRGNLNNDIGLPLTLLRLRSHHQAAVVELGMNHPDETRWLAWIAAPTVVLVTNAQREHQEFMQSVDAVAAEHALAITSLPADGCAVFPRNDAGAATWRHAAGARRSIDFGVDEEAADASVVSAVAHLDLFDTVVHLATPLGSVTARLATAGLHNAYNATAAAAASIAAGLPLAAIQSGLERFVPVSGRLQPWRTAAGVLVIDDTYNANPDSMRAAIDVLAASPGPTLLVVGDMGEVGALAEDFHAEIGHFARDRGIGEMLAVGRQMQAATRAFGAGALHFASMDELIVACREWLARFGQEGATILVKGSRFMTMELVIRALQDGDRNAPQAGGNH